MKTAIPTIEGNLAMHFGHCEVFTIFEVETKKIVSRIEASPPAHEPGALPAWLHELGVNLIIAGGMGMRAKQLFSANEIDVLTGSPSLTPEDLLKQYLDGTLETGENICDH